jgi:hypothetical protein
MNKIFQQIYPIAFTGASFPFFYSQSFDKHMKGLHNFQIESDAHTNIQ